MTLTSRTALWGGVLALAAALAGGGVRAQNLPRLDMDKACTAISKDYSGGTPSKEVYDWCILSEKEVLERLPALWRQASTWLRRSCIRQIRQGGASASYIALRACLEIGEEADENMQRQFPPDLN